MARRFTNVVLARRSVVGRSSSARDSAASSAAIAPVVALALPTRSARSSRRSAIAVTACEELTRKRVSAPSSSVSCSASTREVDSSGLKYFADWPASWPLPSYWVAKPLMTFWRSPRVFWSSALKTWSRSTTVVVFVRSSVPPSRSSLLLSGASVSAM